MPAPMRKCWPGQSRLPEMPPRFAQNDEPGVHPLEAERSPFPRIDLRQTGNEILQLPMVGSLASFRSRADQATREANQFANGLFSVVRATWRGLLNGCARGKNRNEFNLAKPKFETAVGCRDSRRGHCMVSTV